MRAGHTVNSRYQLETPLGSGGFSEVWRGTDLETGKAIALKLARAGREAEGNAKLREEAEILRALNHPNIVRFLDSGVGETSDQTGEFLVTELIDGPTLREVLRESGPMSDEDVLAIGASLADALAAAHGRGFVHGDVKPENIIMRSGEPYLIDFGTARNLAETLGPEELRQIAGTLAYIAPELLAGEPLSTRSDVYALGVTLYEARAGRLPFAGGGGTLAGSEGRRPSPLRQLAPDVDPRLESTIMQSLAIDPAWRPGTAGDIRERLASGRHDTVQVQPARNGASNRVRDSAVGAAAAAALGRGVNGQADADPGFEPPRRGTSSNYDEWLDSERQEPALPRAVLTALALAALVLLAALGAATLLRRDSGEPNPPAGRDESPVAAAAVSTDTPTVAAPTATPEPPTSTPLPTATPSPEPPPPTTPPQTGQQIGAPLDSESAAGRVIQWYDLVVARRFDEAYALWSDRMKANFPRQGNLDGRWANTVSVAVNDVRPLSQSGERMTVAIDFVETLTDGTSRRFVGSWQLVASNDGWLLDSPSF